MRLTETFRFSEASSDPQRSQIKKHVKTSLVEVGKPDRGTRCIDFGKLSVMTIITVLPSDLEKVNDKIYVMWYQG